MPDGTSQLITPVVLDCVVESNPEQLTFTARTGVASETMEG